MGCCGLFPELILRRHEQSQSLLRGHRKAKRACGFIIVAKRKAIHVELHFHVLLDGRTVIAWRDEEPSSNIGKNGCLDHLFRSTFDADLVDRAVLANNKLDIEFGVQAGMYIFCGGPGPRFTITSICPSRFLANAA